jgi:hypothetical protein
VLEDGRQRTHAPENNTNFSIQICMYILSSYVANYEPVNCSFIYVFLSFNSGTEKENDCGISQLFHARLQKY